MLPFIGEPSNLTADGSVMTGVSSEMVGYWTWSEAEGMQEIGGFARAGGNPWISDDGTKVAGNFELPGNALLWAIYDRPGQTWTILPTPDLNSWKMETFGGPIPVFVRTPWALRKFSTRRSGTSRPPLFPDPPCPPGSCPRSGRTPQTAGS